MHEIPRYSTWDQTKLEIDTQEYFQICGSNQKIRFSVALIQLFAEPLLWARKPRVRTPLETCLNQKIFILYVDTRLWARTFRYNLSNASFEYESLPNTENCVRHHNNLIQVHFKTFEYLTLSSGWNYFYNWIHPRLCNFSTNLCWRNSAKTLRILWFWSWIINNLNNHIDATNHMLQGRTRIWVTHNECSVL